MARLSNIKLHQEKKQAIAPQQQPPLEKIDPVKGYESMRSQALANTAEDKAEEAMDFWNASGKEFWGEKVKKDPTSVYAAVNEFLASSETPEEKRKRERREAVGEAINGLGNLIGNVANLYYAPRSGYSIDLNTMDDKRRERMERIQAKRDALDNQRQQMILNAKIGDIKAEREAKIAADKAKADAAKDARDKAWKIKYDAYMKELDNAYKLGQIDAQTKAKLAEQAAKAKSDKELESFKQSNRIALKTTPSYGENKVITSLTGADGGTWTRNTSLSKEEMRELAKYVEDWSPYTTVNEETGEEKIDYIGAIADASDSGVIPDYILEEKGFKRSAESSRRKGKTLPGVESNGKGKSKHLNLK